mmetsp:Transcript_20722/g.34206  ORF Transcript_20722/g.34206 Transcript_20722/m.34206 type:complete len:562 (-) Transcript_20722:137-1822(-)
MRGFATCMVALVGVVAGRRKFLMNGESKIVESPYVLEQPIDTKQKTRLCTVTVFDKVQFTEWNEPVWETVDLEECGQRPNEWGMVVVDLQGRVGGRQFDRFGAMWVNNSEVLRLTTPEPHHPGNISWTLSRDLTEYTHLFSDRFIRAGMVIPNVVNEKYTGVLELTVTLSIYYRWIPDVQPMIPYVSSLAIANESDPLNSIKVFGDNVYNGEIKLPIKNAGQVYLDVYATGHGKEEFYYSDQGNDTTPFREIVVYVDGEPYFGQIPFPVVYTGGINPGLWRPISGILSFQVEPYRFDLSPFVGVLNDGHPHNISVAIAGVGKTPDGYWFVDAVLIAYPSIECSSISGDLQDINTNFHIPTVVPNKRNVSKTLKQNFVGSTVYCMKAENETRMRYRTESYVKFRNHMDDTSFWHVVQAKESSTCGFLPKVVLSRKYKLSGFVIETDDSIKVPKLTQQRDISYTFHDKSVGHNTIKWENNYDGEAYYSITPHVPSTSRADASFVASCSKTGGDSHPISVQEYSQANGTTTKSITYSNGAKLYAHLNICGNSLCGWRNFVYHNL